MNELRDKNGLTEAEAIAVYRTKNYPKPALTADIIVLTRQDGQDKLLMIRRGGHPFLGCWALPGGFAEQGETIEQTAARELEEETGVSGLSLELVGIYSKPGRDPRGWTVSAAYVACVPADAIRIQAGDDAAAAQWVDYEVTRAADGSVAEVRLALPGGGQPAFDHMEIITDAVRKAL
ncbi:MAG: NUDIX hydrolase [Mogibacterium sp.]|nr:NUDIX hydrolase [Mogibacterium sp.]